MIYESVRKNKLTEKIIVCGGGERGLGAVNLELIRCLYISCGVYMKNEDGF